MKNTILFTIIMMTLFANTIHVFAISDLDVNKSLVYAELSVADKDILNSLILDITNRKDASKQPHTRTDLSEFLIWEFPELISLKNIETYTYTNEEEHKDYTTYKFTYHDTDTVGLIKNKINQINVLANIMNNDSDYDKSYKIANAVNESIRYEARVKDMETWATNGSGNCQTYTKLCTILLRKNSVKISFVTGGVKESNELHMWNVAEIEGKLMHVDAVSNVYVGSKLHNNISNTSGPSSFLIFNKPNYIPSSIPTRVPNPTPVRDLVPITVEQTPAPTQVLSATPVPMPTPTYTSIASLVVVEASEEPLEFDQEPLSQESTAEDQNEEIIDDPILNEFDPEGDTITVSLPKTGNNLSKMYVLFAGIVVLCAFILIFFRKLFNL